MTDNKIKKALDEAELFLQNRVKDGQPIKLSEYDVGKLRNISQTCAKAYDKIDQLQTENENLKVENQSLRSAANSLKMHYEEAQTEIKRLKECPKCVYEYDGEITEYCIQSPCSNFKTVEQVKAEAYKEFVERLKHSFFDNGYESPDVDFDYFVDTLVKEMVGDDNE